MLSTPYNAIVHHKKDIDKRWGRPKLMGVLKPFCRGCNGRVYDWHNKQKAGTNLAVYGVLFGQRNVLDTAKNFFYIDNGYFQTTAKKGTEQSWFRITHNTYYSCNEGPDKDDKRLSEFNVRLRKWRETGSVIYVCPPSVHFQSIMGLQNWESETISDLKKYTDRPIKVSTKRDPIDWNKDIWAVVTCMSGVQVKALCNGIPVITTHFTKIGALSDIENPPMDRQILCNLSYQQWQRKHMHSGQAWKDLCELYG